MRPSIETRILSTYLAGAEVESRSISELARLTHAAYPHVHAATTALVKRGVLASTTIGKAVYCAPDLANERCRQLLSEANLDRKERLLIAPNAKNLDAEVRRLAAQEPRLLAVLRCGDTVRCVVSDLAAQRDLLKTTQLLNVSFSTPDALRKELLISFDSFRGCVVLFGYDRLLLLLSPIQQQLRLNHSVLYRGTQVRR